MILFHNIVQIAHLADFYHGLVLGVIAGDSCRVGSTAIDCNPRRHAVAADRLGEKALGRLFIPLSREEEVDGLAALSMAR